MFLISFWNNCTIDAPQFLVQFIKKGVMYIISKYVPEKKTFMFFSDRYMVLVECINYNWNFWLIHCLISVRSMCWHSCCSPKAGSASEQWWLSAKTCSTPSCQAVHPSPRPRLCWTTPLWWRLNPQTHWIRRQERPSGRGCGKQPSSWGSNPGLLRMSSCHQVSRFPNYKLIGGLKYRNIALMFFKFKNSYHIRLII